MIRRIVLGVMLIAVLFMGAPVTQVKASPGADITLLNPPSYPFTLQVGESYTFELEIDSDEPFILAVAMTDSYYPGRGVFWHGSDRATHGSYAVLQLTMTGKKSTSEPLPVSISVGVRYKGGLVLTERFDFSVEVQ